MVSDELTEEPSSWNARSSGTEAEEAASSLMRVNVRITEGGITHGSGDGVQHAIQSHGALLGQHDQLIRSLLDNNQQLLAQVIKLTADVATLSAWNHSLPSPRPSSPPPVSGCGDYTFLGTPCNLAQAFHWRTGWEGQGINFTDSEEAGKPEAVLSPSCIVAAVQWEIESLVKAVQATDPGPGDGPPNCLFVPEAVRALTKLPSASETADLIVQHVFRPHGIPVDIVSDRGPQFISCVESVLCCSGCVCHQVFILNPMDRRREQIRT
ncbi:uncharacterized protein LOC114558173 [Perca flavescens]|uniref:uncharacterized protein LOC114558173 n=1 Tax=Perca flavescens TaxID=8167 RepID=UPI00106E8173|nr:uncharacterized protein LOC114558173 [Perca flavescens]